MIERKHIDVFIEGLRHYFSHLDLTAKDDNDSLYIGAPYLMETDKEAGLDYTGVISISGNSTGHIFFSAKSSLLNFILLKYGERDFSELFKRDLVGEVANTLAGNARKVLGSEFHISPPKVINGKINPRNYRLSSRCYILPMRWNSNKAELIISI